MKKRLITQIIISLIVMMVPIHLAGSESITYSATYTNTCQIGTDTLGGNTYSTVIYGNLHNGGDVGMPSLPVEYINFSVPYNATNFSVTTNTSNNVIQFIGHLLYPCQEPLSFDENSVPSITLPDNNVYNSGQYYPSQKAWVVDEGFLMGENHIVTVAVMPISYMHTSTQNILRRSQNVSVTLNYDLTTNPPMSPITCLDAGSRNEGYLLTRSMVVNPESVNSFAPSTAQVNPLLPNSPVININTASFPYLIVTTPELSHSLRRLVALKRQKGYNVKLTTIDEIRVDPYAQYGDIVSVDGIPTLTFSDDAGKIREYLKLAFWYNQTRYLLLAGTDVPYRSMFAPTDMYYSDLNGNWQNFTTIDRNPEIYVGRILAHTGDQILNYTDKLFKYELNPGKGDFSYLRKALYTEAVQMFDASREVGDYMNVICPDTTIIREKANQQYPKACDVIDSINSNKYGFWSTFNHGGPSQITTYGCTFSGAYAGHMYRLWALDTYKEAGSNYSDFETNNGLNNIENEDYPMISYSMSCETMPYDTGESYLSMPMNFGESFTTGKGYGGPAYLGNTRYGLFPGGMYLETFFAKRLVEGYYKLGESEALSKLDYNDDFKSTVLPRHNLLGDPTLEIWSDIPCFYHDIELTRDDNSITVSGIDADATIIAYCSNDGTVGCDTVHTASAVINNISPNSTVMLYKHNFIPYIAPMILQNINLNNSQYVIVGDLKAGSDIDSNRTPGDVTVKDGVEYEIEVSGTVRLEDGFAVEKGATFAVYPACY